MGQEFFIKSDNLEQKIREILPSQGGLGAGFDLSASTQIIPIVDVTESAEGSQVRADLQTALSFNDVTSFIVENGTSTLINTTGYFRVFGSYNFDHTPAQITFNLIDGLGSKTITAFVQQGTTNTSNNMNSYDFVVFIGAGQSLQCVSSQNQAIAFGCTKQIADINGSLTEPS